MFFFAKTFAKMLQNVCKTFLQMFSMLKHGEDRRWLHANKTSLRPRYSRGKSTALKHFCKCFILHVTTLLVMPPPHQKATSIALSCLSVCLSVCLPRVYRVYLPCVLCASLLHSTHCSEISCNVK